MKTRVLVVEDNKDLLDLFSRQLQFCGFQVATANNGEEAVAMALSEHPDVILMDIVMPRMDGLEAISQIRANPKSRDIPVVALTGRVSASSRQSFMARGFNGYITKPCMPKDLTLVINQLLSDTEKRCAIGEQFAGLTARAV